VNHSFILTEIAAAFKGTNKALRIVNSITKKCFQPSRSFAHFFYFLYCGGPGKRYGSSKKNARGSGAAGGDTRFAPAAIAADVDSFKAQCVCSAVIKRRRSAAAATGSISFVVEFIIRLPLELDSRAFAIVDLKN